VLDEEGGITDAVDAGATPPAIARSCAWCGTAATPEATACTNCGAALAQRESIGDLAIPGLTAVDAALQDYDKRPLHLRGPSASQGMAPALIVGAVAGGPIGIAAIGGVAAVAAAEFLGTRRPGSQTLDEVGKPSEVVLQALEHLEAESAGPGSSAPGTSGVNAGPDGAVDAAADPGLSIWRDLPAAAPELEATNDADQHEEGAADGR
jgi:hypothetical protein